MPLVRLQDLPVRELFPGVRAQLIHTGHVTHSWVEVLPGATFPEHHHPHEQIVSVLSGQLELVVDGTAHELRPGMVFVIPPNVRHSGGSLSGCRVLDTFAPTRDDANPHVMVAPLPLYHIYALTCNCLFMLRDGGCNLLIPNPRDIPGFVKELKNNRFTAISGLNTLYNALLHHPEFPSIDFSQLRLASAGGMAMQKAVADRWQQVTKVPILEGYGLTETSPVATTNPIDITGFSGTIGLPVPSTVVTIRDENENILPVGQEGEICISGPQVMKGYWQRPEETAKVMAKDGALKTGDVGVMDERGFIRIVDRKKDMILVSGFNVYPNELEGVVAMLPGVLEVAVIGVPDEHSGEVPKVFIVRKDPALTEQMVLDHCKEQLTGYKRPKYVEFRKELPKTNVGKILRRALRDEKPNKAA